MVAAARIVTTLIVGGFVLAAAALPVMAQSDEAFIMYRQKVMSGNGDNMGAIGDILKNKLPMTKSIAGHARNLEENFKLVEAAFQKDVSAGATDAKPEVWQKWAEFLKAKDAAYDKAEDLVKAADSGDMAAIGAAVKALGGACGDCHKQFRKPKEESYKLKK